MPGYHLSQSSALLFLSLGVKIRCGSKVHSYTRDKRTTNQEPPGASQMQTAEEPEKET